MELSIKEIIRVLYRRIKIILLIMVISTGFVFIYNQYLCNPVYTASVQLYVNTLGTTTNESLNELNYAQKVVNTYINFLHTKEFYRRVLADTELNYSEQQLEKMTTIETVNATEIFRISVTSNNPKVSYELVESMQKIAPKLIGEIKDNTRISVVDSVTMPTNPSGPNVLLNSMLGGVVGAILAFCLVLIQKLLDVKVKDKEELSARYHHPILGVIPNYNKSSNESAFGKKRYWFKKMSKKRKQENSIIIEKYNFVITEAYKALRTNLRYTLREEGCKKLLINSPTPGDGKSTTCANIAITIAQTGAKVLVIDCDLRKGRLHKIFKVKNAVGISDLISGLQTEQEVIQSTRFDNVSIITMGTLPPNPTELLSSSQIEYVIKTLEHAYDYIIIDSPPVNLVSDAISLAKLVDGILLVVKADYTTHPNVEMAINKYNLVDANILGFVFNGVALSQSMNAKKNYYYYEHSDD